MQQRAPTMMEPKYIQSARSRFSPPWFTMNHGFIPAESFGDLPAQPGQSHLTPNPGESARQKSTSRIRTVHTVIAGKSTARTCHPLHQRPCLFSCDCARVKSSNAACRARRCDDLLGSSSLFQGAAQGLAPRLPAAAGARLEARSGTARLEGERGEPTECSNAVAATRVRDHRAVQVGVKGWGRDGMWNEDKLRAGHQGCTGRAPGGLATGETSLRHDRAPTPDPKPMAPDSHEALRFCPRSRTPKGRVWPLARGV